MDTSAARSSSTSILTTVLPHTDLLSPLLNVFEELAVRLGTVAPEVLEDVRERVLRHGDLQQVVE